MAVLFVFFALRYHWLVLVQKPTPETNMVYDICKNTGFFMQLFVLVLLLVTAFGFLHSALEGYRLTPILRRCRTRSGTRSEPREGRAL